jgi:hypothetical protein
MSDIAVTPASVKLGNLGKWNDETSAEAFDAGDLIAKDVDGNIVKADANGTPPINVSIGVALNSCPGAGQPCRYTNDAPALEGFTTIQGEVYLASTNPGKICPVADLVTTGDTVNYIGIGDAGNKLVVKLHTPGIAIP